MSDDSLRILERALETEGTVAARLRYARALERSQRREDALAVALPARDDPEVRTYVGRCYPVWDTPKFTSHGALYIDTPPLRSRPRVRWIRRLLPEGTYPFDTLLLASPLGVACTLRAGESVQVLDPDTGDLRWEFDSPRTRWPQLVESTICAFEPPYFIARDLWTGEELHRTELEGQLAQALVWRGRLIGWGKQVVLAHRLPNPRQAPGPEVWRSWPSPPGGFALGPRAVLGWKELVFVRAEAGMRSSVLDVESGEARGDLPVSFGLADDRGLVGATLTGVAYYTDPFAKPLWDASGLHALGSEFVVASREEESNGAGVIRLVVQDRESGIRMGVLVDSVHDYGSLAVARDVIYEFTWSAAQFSVSYEPPEPPASYLRAHAPDGSILWELAEEVLGSTVMGLAPLHQGRLYGLTQAGDAFCLEPEEGGG